MFPNDYGRGARTSLESYPDIYHKSNFEHYFHLYRSNFFENQERHSNKITGTNTLVFYMLYSACYLSHSFGIM